MARELVSRVQRMRKDADFAVSDRITLTVVGGEEVQAVLRVHGQWIADEVLATELVTRDGGGAARDSGPQDNQDMTVVDLDGIDARVTITRND
jgi:isoleucyl-tRNA synthetase